MRVYEEFETAMGAALAGVTFKTNEAYNEQDENTEDDDAKGYPAVYYELMEPINWERRGEGWQTAEVTARVHVVCMDVSRSRDRLYTKAQATFEALEGKLLFVGDRQLTTALSRVSSSKPRRLRQLKKMTIDFKFEIFDSSKVTVYETAEVTATYIQA